MNADSPSHNNRRSFFIKLFAGVSTLGAGLLALPFFKSFFPSRRAQAIGAPVKVPLSELEPGKIKTVIWQSKPVLVFRRNSEMKQALSQTSQLADPNSEASEQPPNVKASSRSVSEDYGVLIAYCTHLGCIPKFQDVEGMPGFFCPCHGSKFDNAGRVYSGAPAPVNLVVPPHAIEGQNIRIGDEVA